MFSFDGAVRTISKETIVMFQPNQYSINRLNIISSQMGVEHDLFNRI